MAPDSSRPFHLPTRNALVSFSGDEQLLIAHLAGPRIGEVEAPLMNEQLDTEIERRRETLRAVVLDMRLVQSLASMGLGMCLSARNQAATAGASTVLYGVHEPLEQLLRMMRLHRLCRVAMGPEELRDALTGLVDPGSRLDTLSA